MLPSLPEQAQGLSIRLLHLPKRLCATLEKIGITTINQLYNLTDSELNNTPGIIGATRRRTIKKIKQSLGMVQNLGKLD